MSHELGRSQVKTSPSQDGALQLEIVAGSAFPGRRGRPMTQAECDANCKWPRVTANFVLEGAELDPDECTRRVGMSPDKIWRRPERLAVDQGPMVAWWHVHIEERCYSIEDATWKLIERLVPVKSAILQFAAEQGLSVTFTVYVNHQGGDLPELVCSPELVAEFASWGSEFSLAISEGI